jgi:hypothetical protein
MAKDSTSDKLKEIFAQQGGRESDWKRRDKRKDEDGNWVRVFENAKTGKNLEVTELVGGQFKTRELEAGAAQKAVAAKYVFAIKKDDDDGMTEHGGYYAIISPKAYFEKTGYCYDQPSQAIYDLLPDADDVNECGTWVFNDAKPDARALADDLSARGFIHDPKFQNFIAKDVAAELAAQPKPKAPKPR